MTVFELPKETETIQILSKNYNVDITSFLIIDKIKTLPCMADKYRPTMGQIDFHIKQIQEMFVEILGEQLQFPQATPEKTYIMARSMLKKLYGFYVDKQAGYLDLEYGANDTEMERLRLMESIYKNYPKGVDNNEQPDAH